MTSGGRRPQLNRQGLQTREAWKKWDIRFSEEPEGGGGGGVDPGYLESRVQSLISVEARLAGLLAASCWVLLNCLENRKLCGNVAVELVL